MHFPDSMGLQLSIVITSSPSVDQRCGNGGFEHLLRGPRQVIRIRYAELPAGLHIQAVARGKDTIIYLLPGLTTAQRQAALRRARNVGRMGQGPRLPAAGVAGAMMVDRIRATIRNGAAAMRAHPAVFVPPMMIVLTAAIAYVLLVSVSIRVREPQASGQAGSGAPIAAAVAPPPGSKADDPASRPAPTWRPVSSAHSRRPAPKPSGDGQRTGSPAPSPSASPSAGGPDPAPTPSPSPSFGSSPSPEPTPSAGGTNSGAAGSSGGAGLCLNIGLLGVCLGQ
jgi:hypothetical protein